MQCRARPPVDRHQSSAEGGSRGKAPRKGGLSWGGRTAPGTPAAPTHLDPPIPWSVSNVRTAADHRRSRWWSSWRYITGIEPARQGGRSVVVVGNAAVRRGPKARLRRAAARAAAWAHRVVPAGERAGKGGRRSPPELSELSQSPSALLSLLPWLATQNATSWPCVQRHQFRCRSACVSDTPCRSACLQLSGPVLSEYHCLRKLWGHHAPARVTAAPPFSARALTSRTHTRT